MMQEENRDHQPERRGVRARVDSLRDAAGRSLDRATGAEYRRQFDEFVEVVSTTVIGVHRDQARLTERVDALEQGRERSGSGVGPKLAISVLAISTLALIVGIVALVRTI